jgi:hypothetical protein
MLTVRVAAGGVEYGRREIRIEAFDELGAPRYKRLINLCKGDTITLNTRPRAADVGENEADMTTMVYVANEANPLGGKKLLVKQLDAQGQPLCEPTLVAPGDAIVLDVLTGGSLHVCEDDTE